MEQQVLEVIRGLLEMPVWFVELDLHKMKIMLNNGVELKFTMNGHLTVVSVKPGFFNEDEAKVIRIIARSKIITKVENFLENILKANWQYVNLTKQFDK